MKIRPKSPILDIFSLCSSSIQEMKGSHLFSCEAKAKEHFHGSSVPQVGKLTLVFMKCEREGRRSRQSQFVAKHSENDWIKTPNLPKP